MTQVESEPTRGPSPFATAEEEDLIALAESMRPMLLEEQAATEQRTFYSEETHERFKEAGFYRLHVPKRYGGLEYSLSTFYRIVMAIARGCPSTGWMLSLGAGHAQQIGAFFSEQAQDEIFGEDGDFIASASYAHEKGLAIPVDGGYLVSGTWHFCSGVPYATHHIGMMPTKTGDLTMDDLILAVIPRDKFRRLDNWGDLIGMKGSGSHSVVVEETFIPAHHTVSVSGVGSGSATDSGSVQADHGASIGYELHGNPLYGGPFNTFAGARLSAVQVGAAMGAIDEFERIIKAKKTISLTNEGTPKFQDHNYQRCLGLATAWAESAYSLHVQVGTQYTEYVRRATEYGEPFDEYKDHALLGQLLTAARLCWDAGDTVFRAAGTGAARDGERMQRYWRDLCAYHSNVVHQPDFNAPALAQARLGLPVDFL